MAQTQTLRVNAGVQINGCILLFYKEYRFCSFTKIIMYIHIFSNKAGLGKLVHIYTRIQVFRWGAGSEKLFRTVGYHDIKQCLPVNDSLIDLTYKITQP